MSPENLILGMVIGALLALTGAGGGILAVPLLVFGAHLGMTEAAPIGLLAVAMAASLGAILGLKAGTVRYRAALLAALAGMLASPLGNWIARTADTRWLGILFALTLLHVAYRALRPDDAQADDNPAGAMRTPPCVRSSINGRFLWTTRCARSLTLAGSIAGLLSGLFGVGGGFVMVPALQRYTDLDMQSIVPTSLAVIALVSIASVISNAAAGSLNWMVAMPFAAGSLAGMMAGRVIAAYVAGPAMQKAFGLASAAVAAAMIMKFLA